MAVAGVSATLASFAVPYEGCGSPVPPCHRRLQPRDDLRWRLGMLPRQCPPGNDALDRLRPMQPGPAQGCL